MVDVGGKAPAFTLADQDGTAVSLSDLRGSPVVLYFYPRADTPGCTTQACDIRDQWAEFEDAGAVVLGVSPDTVEAQSAFAGKYDLPHRLLADPDREVITTYGAWGPRRIRGRERDGVIRSTVLIDADGTVAQVWPDVAPKDHADQVLEALSDL